MEKVLLRNIDLADSHTLAVYQSRGGYRGWEKILKLPEEMAEELINSK